MCKFIPMCTVTQLKIVLMEFLKDRSKKRGPQMRYTWKKLELSEVLIGIL